MSMNTLILNMYLTKTREEMKRVKYATIEVCRGSFNAVKAIVKYAVSGHGVAVHVLPFKNEAERQWIIAEMSELTKEYKKYLTIRVQEKK